GPREDKESSMKAPRPIPQQLTLLPQHREKLERSGLSEAVIEARGYRSLTKPVEAENLGFSARQARFMPALHIPGHTTHGERRAGLLRPDDPPMREGRVQKYLAPKGATNYLDVPPSVRDLLDDPHIPLGVTEGILKADSAASRGIACIAVNGVF